MECDDGLHHGRIDEGLVVHGNCLGSAGSLGGFPFAAIGIRPGTLPRGIKDTPLESIQVILPPWDQTRMGVRSTTVTWMWLGKPTCTLTLARSGKAVRRLVSIWDGMALKMGCPARPRAALTSAASRRWLPLTFGSRNDECVGGPHGVEQEAQEQGQSGRDPARAQLGQVERRSVHGGAAQAKGKIVAILAGGMFRCFERSHPAGGSWSAWNATAIRWPAPACPWMRLLAVRRVAGLAAVPPAGRPTRSDRSGG